MNEVLIGKQQNIERCVRRARDAWEKPSDLPFAKDYDKQDIVLLNLQRAGESALGMANHAVRAKNLGWPENGVESFAFIREAGIIDDELEKKLRGMVGFGNVVIHQYKSIDLDLVEQVLRKDADDLIEFAGILVSTFSK